MASVFTIMTKYLEQCILHSFGHENFGPQYSFHPFAFDFTTSLSPVRPPDLFSFPKCVRRCWCGDESADYAKLGALDMTECAYPCAGDDDLFCGGFDAFQIFSMPADASLGHLGCYADVKDDRLFKAGKIDLEHNGVEVSSVMFGQTSRWTSKCFFMTNRLLS